MGTRAGENIYDGFQRGPIQAYQRLDNPSGQPFASVSRLPEFGIARRIAGALTGREVSVPNVAAQRERERRAQYEARAAADPISNVGDGAAYFAGQLAGGAMDPTSWIGGGGSFAGRQGFAQVGRQVARNAATEGAANAVADVAAQGLDVTSGTQDRYDPFQTLLSAGVGATLSGGMDAGRLGSGPSARAVGRGFNYARWAAGNASDQMGARFANPLPSFDGAAMASGPFPGPPESIRRPGGRRRPAGPDLSPQPPSTAPRVAIPEAFAPAIRRASSETGVSADYLASLANRESAFNPTAQAGTSSARGLYQFTEGTWLETLRRHGDRLGLSNVPALIAGNRDGVLSLRDNPDLAIAAAALHSQDNARDLANVLGRAPTDSELYTAHFLGSGGARQLATADPAAPASRLFPDAAAANRSIFYQNGRPRTVAEVRAQLAEGFGGGSTVAAIPIPEGPLSREASPYVADTLTPRPLDDAALGIGPAPARAADAGPTTADPMRSASFDRVLADVNRPVDPLSPATRGPASQPDSPPEVLVARGVGRSTGFDPAKPFTVADGATPNRLAARSGFDPARPFTKGQTLAVDMSGYDNRLGAGPATRPATQMRGQPQSTGQGSSDYAGQTVSTLAEKVRTSLGLTHRQGRVSSSRAAGTYDTKSGVIRTRAARHAMSVLTHEGGHALEYRRTPTLAAALKAHEAELKPMAYEGAAPGVLREEGFAEFFRLYLTNPALARRDAPRFYDAFEAALRTDMPDTAADLLGIQKGYGDLLAANSLDVAASSIAYTGSPGVLGAVHKTLTESGLSGSLLKLADEVYRGIYDTNHPFNVWVREIQKRSKTNTGSRQNLAPADHPYVLARIANHSGNVAQSDITHGVTPADGIDPVGPSLTDVNRIAFKGKDPAPEQDARFAGYLIARRMVQEWDRYSRGELDRTPDKPEHDKAFHERVIADAERLNPTWREASDKANEWGRNLWKLKFDKGLLTQQMFDAANANRTYHVPFQRDVSDLSKPGGRGRASGVGQFAGGAKGFEGSERDIIHPLVSMVKDAFETRAVIARNETVSAMRRAMEKAGPNAGDLLEELPADQTHAIEVGALDAMKAAVKALGLDDRDTAISSIFQAMEAEKSIKATLFQSGPFTPRKNEAVVFEWRNGEAKPYLLPDGWLGKKLFEAIGTMTGDTRTVWEEVAGAAAQALRVGITGVPEFAIKTTLRDQLAAAILTDVGFVPFADTARGLADAVTGSPNMRRYQAAGGLMGGETMAATRRAFPKNDVEAKRQLKRLRTRIVSSPADLMKGVAHLADVGDTATRLSVFRKTLERELANGESPARAVIAARQMSANFFDPSRIGAWAGVRQVARSVPFFNSGLQGPDIAVRVIRHAFSKPETMRDKAAFRQAVWALSGLAATSMLGLAVWSAYHDDPDFQNINDQTRATHWPMMKLASGEWLLYPKSFELGMPSNLTERLAQALTEGDAKVFARIRADILNTMAPTRDAPILAVPFQAAANQDRNGTPIIPDHLRTGVEPDLQVNAWTSDTAKMLAGNAMSPAILEHYITGFFGSAGRDALKLGDMAIGAATGQPSMAGRAPDMMITRGFVRRTARGSDSERTFWDLAARDGRLERAYRSYGAYLRDGSTTRADQYLAGLSPQERSYVGAMAALEGETRMAHPLFRAREAVGAISDIRRENRDGVLLGPDGRILRMTPEVRRAIDDGLDDLALAEIHNALVVTNARGWETRERIDAGAIFARIAEDDPRVATALISRWSEAKVPPSQIAEQVWSQLRPAFEGVRSEQLAPAMQARRLQGSGKNDEIRRRVAETQQPLRRGAPARPTPTPTPPRGLLGQEPRTGGLLSQ